MFYWDYKNRLIGAGGNNVGYKYSGGDLRLARTKDGKTTLYFYHGNSLIAEKTSDGKVRKVFTHDNRGVLGMTRYVYDETDTYKSKQNLYYMFDDLGSVTAITDDTGTPVQMYVYDAYGNVTNTQNDPINNFAFVGRYGGFRDWDTGLTQFLHRWYDSKDGRWLSRDPIGVDGAINLYDYVDNNSVNFIDIFGLQKCTEAQKKKNCLDKCNCIYQSFDLMLTITGGKILKCKPLPFIFKTTSDVTVSAHENISCNEICSDPSHPKYRDWYNCEEGFDQAIDRCLKSFDEQLQKERENR